MGLSIKNWKDKARHLMIFVGKTMNFILFLFTYSLKVVDKRLQAGTLLEKQIEGSIMLHLRICLLIEYH